MRITPLKRQAKTDGRKRGKEEMKKGEVRDVSPMVGGDGPHSYSANSTYQGELLDAAKGLMIQAIRDNLQDFRNPFTIADLGCSTGSNAFFAIRNIIDVVQQKYHETTQTQSNPDPPLPLEFQVFFNDLKENDFNTLFKTLHSSSHGSYFAAGVPGSFYTRLFPKSTIHIAHSSYSLHWLSQVPPDVIDSKSPAWNKGSIQRTGFSRQVSDAYLAQYKHDMNTFLNARAEEIVGGGLMVILVAGLPDGILMSQTGVGIFYDMLGSCLVDLANSGEISEEKVESFNLPLYYSTPKELKSIIEVNGYFSIERMEEMTHPWVKNAKPKVEMAGLMLRSAFEGILKDHFGNESNIIDRIFQHFTKKLGENYYKFDGVTHQNIELFVVLKRNPI